MRRYPIVRAMVIVSALGAAAWPRVSAQSPGIVVGPNVQVSRARAGDPHYEVLAAADPTNASRLIAGGIYQSDQVGGTVAYLSEDGGETWTPTLTTPPAGHEGVTTSDPALTYAPDGTALFLASLLPPNSSGPTRKMLLYRSRDAGKTWQPPVFFTYSDREYVVVDGTGGPYHGRIYVNGNSRVGETAGGFTAFYSTDGGATFTESRMPKLPRATTMGNAVVLSDGTVVGLYAAAQSASPENRAETPSWLQVSRSTDGGQSFGPPIEVAAVTLVAGRKGAHNNTLSLPTMAADGSTGRFKDRLYVLWPEYRNGYTDIYLCSSKDRGQTWSAPRLVNDAPAPRHQALAVDHFMPTVAVNKDGVLGVMWYDRRNRLDNMGWEVRFTASQDGAETFLPSVAVSGPARGTTMGSGERWILDSIARKSPEKKISVDLMLNTFTFLGGDTAGLVADAGGTFHPVWVDNSTGIPQIWTAPVTVTRADARMSSTVTPAAGPREDVTESVTVETDQPEYDRGRSLVTVRLRVLNSSDRALPGPLSIRVATLQSPLGDLSAVNAHRGGGGAGAEWDLAVADTGLAPGARTPRQTLTFRLANLRPFRDGTQYQRGVLKMDLVVLAAASGAARQR